MPLRIPPRTPLCPGARLGSRYRLICVAGAGGMSTVWRAHDERLERPVAVKVLSDALAGDPDAVARFIREAHTHAQIHHPNLVQVYDYRVTGDPRYLVMEYVDGCTLSRRLDRGSLSSGEVHTRASQLLSAVACVHDHHVLHRDIKCGNVLLDGEGNARLSDFGLARLEDSAPPSPAGEVVGTLRFLAPELLEGRPASRQSDLYALGVLLRAAATRAHVDPALGRAIRWLTEPDPEWRPSDARAVITALRNGQRHRDRPAPTRRIRSGAATRL